MKTVKADKDVLNEFEKLEKQSNEVRSKKRDENFKQIDNIKNYRADFHNLDDEENKYLKITLILNYLPPIDLYDFEQVDKRVAEFFAIMTEFKVKPTVSGLALALDMDRAMLRDLAMGTNNRFMTMPIKVVGLVKKVYATLEANWELAFSTGKINPVSGIFLAKNNFGYTDKVENVISTELFDGKEPTLEDIKEKYK